MILKGGEHFKEEVSNVEIGSRIKLGRAEEESKLLRFWGKERKERKKTVARSNGSITWRYLKIRNLFMFADKWTEIC